MLRRVYFDNGSYVPSTLEDEIDRIQANAASTRELFGVFDGLHVSVTNDTDDMHKADEDSELDSDADGEVYWSKVIAQQRLRPVNPFERRLYYRVDHSGSQFENADGDLLARLTPPRDIERIQETDMREWVKLHAKLKDQPLPTPLISVATGLLQALKFAENLLNWGCQDIRITVIDGWSLSKTSTAPVNSLRRRLRLSEIKWSIDECYIWARIPRSSIIRCWQWKLVRPAFLTLIPPLDCNRGRGFTTSSLIEVLVVELQMNPSSMLTKRIAIEILSWTKGQQVSDMTRWNIALNSPKSMSKNWEWTIQHLDHHLFSRYVDEIAPRLGRTTLAHSLYSSFDHWWYGREEAEMILWVEGRQYECIGDETSCQWFDPSHGQADYERLRRGNFLTNAELSITNKFNAKTIRQNLPESLELHNLSLSG